ncbi:Thi4 domain protein, partial [Lentinula aff. detonsa]
RATDSTDVLIVGAGPAGLAAAIRIKQVKSDLRVVVLEKGGEVGSHILSGCVLEPTALYDLLGKDLSTYSSKHGCGEPRLGVNAGKSEMVWLTGDTSSMIPGQRAIRIPHPPQMNNKGNYIISLSAFTRWLGRVAEEHYGVEVYPGFAGAG